MSNEKDWVVRERRSADGDLRDCFVEAPKEGEMAYGLEVLGDDYTGYGGVERKLAHCKQIVAQANAKPLGWFYKLPEGTDADGAERGVDDGGVYLGCTDQHAATVVANDDGEVPFPLYAAPPPISWHWLRGIVSGMRGQQHNMIGTGQNFTYVQKNEVLDWIDEGERRQAAAPADPLEAVKDAIREHHFALDTRQHGGVAQNRAFEAICRVLNMHWVQGAEKARRDSGSEPKAEFTDAVSDGGMDPRNTTAEVNP